MDGKYRSFNQDENIKVVQSNEFIEATKYYEPINMGSGKLYTLKPLSLNATKLMRIAIAQCKIEDDYLFYYRIKIVDLIHLLDVDKSHIYKNASDISDELLSIRIENKYCGFRKMVLFDTCEYNTDEHEFIIGINPRLSHMFLNLKRDYTQYILTDILSMKCKYAIPLYELIRKELKQGASDYFVEKTIRIPIKQIRNSLGLTKLLNKTSHLTDRAIKPSIKEMSAILNWDISYSVIKRGHDAEQIEFIIVNKNNLS